jgi:hypothetical protein
MSVLRRILGRIFGPDFRQKCTLMPLLIFEDTIFSFFNIGNSTKKIKYYIILVLMGKIFRMLLSYQICYRIRFVLIKTDENGDNGCKCAKSRYQTNG